MFNWLKTKQEIQQIQTNYRPIALDTALSRVFEFSILLLNLVYEQVMSSSVLKINILRIWLFIYKNLLILLIIRILFFWYHSRTIYIKWGQVISKYFTVSCGVRMWNSQPYKLIAIYTLVATLKIHILIHYLCWWCVSICDNTYSLQKLFNIINNSVWLFVWLLIHQSLCIAYRQSIMWGKICWIILRAPQFENTRGG